VPILVVFFVSFVPTFFCFVYFVMAFRVRVSWCQKKSRRGG